MREMTLKLGGETLPVSIDAAVLAGWTGRDSHAVEQHIAELKALGVARPSAVPIFYRVSGSRVTTSEQIESTIASSGEVEAVLLRERGALWVGVGSDHTDREVETYGVAVSKQMCDKPIAAEMWAFDEVVDHWDELMLRSWMTEDGVEVLYQEGALAAMLRPERLLSCVDPQLPEKGLMLCGTLAARGGVRFSESFRYELEDPVRGRSISGRYAVRPLPLVS